MRLQERVTSYWNGVGSRYLDARITRSPAESSDYRVWLQVVDTLLPRRHSEVLDVGTGAGFLARIIAVLGHSVTGIDLADAMLEAARKQTPASLGVRWLKRDAVEPAFAPRSFDVIASHGLIWTLLEPQAAFRSWYRLLRPQGRVVMIYGLRPPRGNLAAKRNVTSSDNDGFLSYYTDEVQQAIPGMYLTSHDQIINFAADASFSGLTVVPLEDLRGIATSLTSTPPFALTAYRR
jgi:SAM-dependent methyltransferase